MQNFEVLIIIFLFYGAHFSNGELIILIILNFSKIK